MKLTQLQEVRYAGNSIIIVEVIWSSDDQEQTTSTVGPFLNGNQAQKFVELLEKMEEDAGNGEYIGPNNDGVIYQATVSSPETPDDFIHGFTEILKDYSE